MTRKLDAMHPEVEAYLDARAAERDAIAPERLDELGRLAEIVRGLTAGGAAASVVFVCTHNSRRSQLAQVWALAAAWRFGVALDAYSGGTEATAFHPSAVAALERAGVRITIEQPGENPVYAVGLGEGPVLRCFSTVHNEPPNPRSEHVAVMVCASADAACPAVPGASARLALRYDDPKVADGTPDEVRVYDERCAQICREMLETFRRVIV